MHNYFIWLSMCLLWFLQYPNHACVLVETFIWSWWFSFKLINWSFMYPMFVCLIFFYRLKLLRGCVMPRKQQSKFLDCRGTRILQENFRWTIFSCLSLFPFWITTMRFELVTPPALPYKDRFDFEHMFQTIWPCRYTWTCLAASNFGLFPLNFFHGPVLF